MSKKNVVVLDGTANGEDGPGASYDALGDVLQENNAAVKWIRLKDMAPAHCIGCFGCWVKTPGICVANDAGREIARSVIQSDMVILYTPVMFGGLSSLLKKIVDRLIPLLSPYFQRLHGETRHLMRYAKYPRILGIGIQQPGASDGNEIFKALIARIAANFHAPTFAAAVVNDDADKAGIKQQLTHVIYRSDPRLNANAMASFFPKITKSDIQTRSAAGHALLVVGSPKRKQRSTSAVMGEYLLDELKTAGWTTEALTLNRHLVQEQGQAELCAAVDRCDLILLAFPLYIDSLPYLVTRALEVIADHRIQSPHQRPQRLFALVNNGYPEPHNNALALAICRCFADQCGIDWAGALAMGAGEAIGGGEKLDQAKRPGPPVKHVIRALQDAGENLAKGKAVDGRAQRLIAKIPVPLIPIALWHWMFIKLGAQFWNRQAIQNGVKKEEMHARPYAL